MSVRQLARVWEYQFSKGEQSVMLSMADHANDEGGSIFPSVARIAWKTDYSKRQVQRIIGALTESGILILTQKETRRRPREYRIDWSKAKKKAPFRGDTMSKRGVTLDNNRGDISDVRGDIAVSSEPSLLNHQLPTIKENDPFESFVSFWNLTFPKKKLRASNKTLRAKFITRMKDLGFAKEWNNAIQQSSESPALVQASWFQATWFLRNDENYLRALNNEWAWKDKQIAKENAAQGQRQKSTSEKIAKRKN